MQVKSKLKGHSKRITGLAFSHALNVLVSSGADAQVIIFLFNYYLQIALLISCELNLINFLNLVI